MAASIMSLRSTYIPYLHHQFYVSHSLLQSVARVRWCSRATIKSRDETREDARGVLCVVGTCRHVAAAHDAGVD